MNNEIKFTQDVFTHQKRDIWSSTFNMMLINGKPVSEATEAANAAADAFDIKFRSEIVGN